MDAVVVAVVAADPSRRKKRDPFVHEYKDCTAPHSWDALARVPQDVSMYVDADDCIAVAVVLDHGGSDAVVVAAVVLDEQGDEDMQ